MLDSHFFLRKPPYSSNQLKKLGKSLTQGTDFERSELWRDFVIQHVKLTEQYSELLFSVITEAPKTLYPDLFTPFSNFGLEISARVKSVDTLQEKLKRSGQHDLSRVRDVSGLRVQGDISLRNQRLLADRVMQKLRDVGVSCKLIDRISEPIQGYRALHIEINAPAGRSEIQIRTRLQSLWANVSENAGDLFGRELRYEVPSDEMAREFSEILQALSDKNFTTEETWNLNFEQHDVLRENLGSLCAQGKSFRVVLPDGLEPLESSWYELLGSKHKLEQSMIHLKKTLEEVAN